MIFFSFKPSEDYITLNNHYIEYYQYKYVNKKLIYKESFHESMTREAPSKSLFGDILDLNLVNFLKMLLYL